MWRRFVSQVKRLPNGFSNVYMDLKQSFRLQQPRHSPVELTRRERAVIKRGNDALLMAGGFAALRMFPGIGFFKLSTAYLLFPKQLMSSQFYSNQQKQEYAFDHLLDRRYHASHFLSSQEIEAIISSPHLLFQNERILRHLAGSVRDYPSKLVVKHLPLHMLTDHIKDVCKDIAEDDTMLLKEGLEGLSLEELREACFARGLVRSHNSVLSPENHANPAAPISARRPVVPPTNEGSHHYQQWTQHNNDDDDVYNEAPGYRHSLQLWLESPHSAALRNHATTSTISKFHPSTAASPAVLTALFAIAQPTFYLQGYKPAF